MNNLKEQIRETINYHTWYISLQYISDPLRARGRSQVSDPIWQQVFRQVRDLTWDQIDE